jgi:hypothetical protein
MPRALDLHRDFHCDAVRTLEVEVARPALGQLALRYVLAGDTERLRLPPPATPARTDELWRRTCFEAFVADAGGAAYVEVNLAPSTRWAAYGFTSYRAGMRVLEEVAAPHFESERSAERFELCAVIDLAAAGLAPDASWRLAVSAVIEEASGARSYWALAHPPGQPDFHHPESFVLELPAR